MYGFPGVWRVLGIFPKHVRNSTDLQGSLDPCNFEYALADPASFPTSRLHIRFRIVERVLICRALSGDEGPHTIFLRDRVPPVRGHGARMCACEGFRGSGMFGMKYNKSGRKWHHRKIWMRVPTDDMFERFLRLARFHIWPYTWLFRFLWFAQLQDIGRQLLGLNRPPRPRVPPYNAH